MDLARRNELPALLKPFGMEYGDSAVETALRATDIKPTRYQGMPGGKGRISLFDPMVALLLASIWETSGHKFSGVDKPMERFRRLYDRAVKWKGASSVPGFDENREFGAQLLLLTSPLYGMEPRLLRRVAREHEQVLEYSIHGRAFLVNVLQAYNNVYGATISASRIDPREAENRTIDQQLTQFAADWLAEAGLWFRTDAHNASEEAKR